MDADVLMKTTIDMVQEVQMKLGPVDGVMSLYLPVSDTGDKTIGEMIAEFEDLSENTLGCKASVLSDGRLRIVVPERGCRYVKDLPENKVLKEMIECVESHISIYEMKTRLEKDHPGMIWKFVNNGEFDSVALFPSECDEHIYCISNECGHLIYHRFTREDYLGMGFELPQSSDV